MKDLRKLIASSKPVKDFSQADNWKNNVAYDTGLISRKGYFLVASTLGVFLVWSILFPLSSAVVSSGKIISLGQNKLLQHPTGGVVRKINAIDGDKLVKGDLILEIDPSVAKAELAQLEARQRLLLAQQTRLDSDKKNVNGFKINKALQLFELRGSNDQSNDISLQTTGSLNTVFIEQQDEYNATSSRFRSELSALENQLKKLSQERDGVELQIVKQSKKNEILRMQLAKLKPLAASGYVAKTRMWDLEARVLEAQSLFASLVARTNSLHSSMNETRDRISIHQSQKKQDNAKELSNVLTELASINQQLDAAKKAVEYSHVKAPVSGTLVKLQTHTIGGVVEAGMSIAEIVPDGQPLLVETRIAPQDIGEINIGQEVDIVITAFNRRVVEPLEGLVKYVAADSSVDKTTGETYFTVRAEFTGRPDLTSSIKTGMQSEVYIQTGSRSFLSYLSAPIMESLRKSFNER